MPYITREDGEHFIIPSYRDVLSAKKLTLLRREVLLLSANYGEYVAIQRKNVNQYEVAFSAEPGYLLGETVWSYFKRPQDLIYCEAIPNTHEAILVIVKSGSVYIDGSFPLDAIVDELVVFRTQQNNFDVYINGDVPISQIPEEGKFALDPASVKSFNILEEPVFPTLPIVKSFQLQLVDAVLKSKGIGVLPKKQIISALILLAFIWGAWSFLTTHKKEIPVMIVRASNPYQLYVSSLNTPDPANQIRWLTTNIWLLSTIPGWHADVLNYSPNGVNTTVRSMGARTNLLFEWADANHAIVQIDKTGFTLTINSRLNNRGDINAISPLDRVVANLIDSMSYVNPGNNVQVGPEVNKGRFLERELKVNFTDITPTTLDLIGQQFKNLPLVLVGVSITITDGLLTGIITLRALGN